MQNSETAEAQLLSFISDKFSLWSSLSLTHKLFLFLFQFVVVSLPETVRFLTPTEITVSPSSLSHSFSTSSFTPLQHLPPTCPYPSPAFCSLTPALCWPSSKDSGRFTHTQLHSRTAFLRSVAAIWKFHITKCDACT